MVNTCCHLGAGIILEVPEDIVIPSSHVTVYNPIVTCSGVASIAVQVYQNSSKCINVGVYLENSNGAVLTTHLILGEVNVVISKSQLLGSAIVLVVEEEGIVGPNLSFRSGQPCGRPNVPVGIVEVDSILRCS